MKPLLKPVMPHTPRSDALTLRLTKSEKAAIEDLADRSLVTVSELMRAALNDYAASVESTCTSRVVVGEEAESLFLDAMARGKKLA